MQKLILVILFIVSVNISFGQKLTKDETDDFTGSSIKETSWETFSKKSSFYSYTSFQKIDDRIFLKLKMVINGGRDAYYVDEGQVLFLRMDDEDIIKLNNPKSRRSSIGEGATWLAWSGVFGIELRFKIESEILKKLKTKLVSKIRIYTDDGYVESKVKEKQAKKFRKLIPLIE